ncbi:MAG: wax ester/triacylglycerol synthase family O-acyltransferase [Deltaproteobacteria bacterium]|nr:wax ester/triacylglycerol synthase family O-acyltransferase [Deltaproteobacteria bacterium]
MRQLSGLDAGFLSLETSTAPMAIGSLSLLDPRTTEGRLEVTDFRQLLRQRLPETVALRRRLASVPLDLTRPYWIEVDAEEVDLDLHVQRTRLPEPGGWHELSELMAWELSQPLDRDRPLWQILFVEGVDAVPGVPKEAVGLISRVHHAAIDGVSGAEILGALFDGSPTVVDTPSVRTGSSPVGTHEPDLSGAGEELPGRRREPRVLDVLTQAGRDLAAGSSAVPKVVGRSLLGLAGSAVSRLRGGASPPLPFSAPRTPMNRPVVAERSWAPAFFDLERVKAIKNAEQTTVNDVILAVCAGALRGWLQDRGELPQESLVAMVPVSVRADQEKGQAGNLVSAMLVSLATEVEGPVERLHKIRDAADSSKAGLRAVGARTLVQSAQLLPFALSGLGVRLYSRLHLSQRHRPLFNLVITNVPGPPRPLTVAGAPLLAHVGAAPIFDGLGLLLAVFSYAGKVSIGVTADRTVMPQPASFAARLTAALDELENALS